MPQPLFSDNASSLVSSHHNTAIVSGPSMNIKLALTAITLAAAASSSFASNGTATFVDSIADYVNPLTIKGGAINDTISFTGLTAGKYDVSLDFSGQQFTLNDLTLNGVHADSIINTSTSKSKFSFAYLDTVGNSPFILNIIGNGVSGKLGSYSGSLSAVAPVPEPETYALMLVGLVGVGYTARRRKAQGSAMTAIGA